MRRTLSVCLSVRLSVRPSRYRRRHGCTFRHALRAAYRTAISAAQIIVRLQRAAYGWRWGLRNPADFLRKCKPTLRDTDEIEKSRGIPVEISQFTVMLL